MAQNMAISLYSLSLFFHILFVVFWMFTIPINTVINYGLNKMDDLKDKFKLLGFVSMNTKISLVSAVIVFLTGGMLVDSGGFSWAPSTYFWLVTKQMIWLLIVVGALVLIRPLDKKMHEQMDNGAELDDVLATYKTYKLRNHIMTGFIIINIFLATTKPF